MYQDFSLEEYIRNGMQVRSKISPEDIRLVAKMIKTTIGAGGKVVSFGNGGSAADAQHFIAELTGHFSRERKPLAAFCLNTNVSGLTAISNDYSYDTVFSRQVEGLVKSEDIVFGISTSGNSRNIIAGIETAKDIGATTVGLTGKSGGKMRNLVDKLLAVESDDTPIIQEVHITMIHMICLELDRIL